MDTTLTQTVAGRPAMTMPGALLRLEGLGYLTVAVAAYAFLGHSWWMFALLLFAPDLVMLGYLFGPRVGALAYNVGHTSTLPLLLGLAGLLFGWALGGQFALIWLAHIGLARTLGYGLKHNDRFAHTHMGEV